MNTPVSKEMIYKLVESRRKMLSYSSNPLGTKTKEVISPWQTNGKSPDKKDVKKHSMYRQALQSCQANHAYFEEKFKSLLPTTLSRRRKDKLRALVDLLVRFDRPVITSMQMILELTNVSWDDLVVLFESFQKSGQSTEDFPRYLLFVWQLHDPTFDESHIFDVPSLNDDRGMRGSGDDLFNFAYELTGIDFKVEGFDAFPWKGLGRKYNTYEWASGKLWVNPDWKDWEAVWEYIKPRLDSGHFTHVLCVIPNDKYHGFSNYSMRPRWAEEILQRKNDHKNMMHAFWLPDGSRYSTKINVWCVLLTGTDN